MTEAGNDRNSGGEDVRRLLRESLQRSWGPLRFPGVLEKAYREHHRQQWLLLTRVSMLVGIVLFAGYALVDFWVFPQQVESLWTMRLAVATPVGIAVFAYTFFARNDTQIQIAYSLLIVNAGAAISVMIIQLPPGTAHFYSSGIVLVIAFTYIVATLRLWYATVTSLLISAIYMVAIVRFREANIDLILSSCADLASINLIGFYAGLVIEVYTRRDFARITLSELDRRRLASNNIELRDLSERDPLTDVANRRTLEKFLNDAWQRAAWHSLPVSVLMLDLDHFKRFNDEHGHQAGDECLKKVAECASEMVREPADLIARYGGEEFVVVLTGTDALAATSIAERIRQAIESAEMPNPDSEEPLAITASVGVATHWPAAGGHPSRLIRAADQVLYQAKREGRNCVRATTD